MAAHSVAMIEVTVEHFGRYDPSHGTPDPMVRRVVNIRLPKGEAHFEQTDYGHPGRFNPWEPRGIEPRLQARTAELRDLCERISGLLE
jgi:hypothetical protein